ncbi:unnamed protein product, partial [Prunus brigantina]
MSDSESALDNEPNAFEGESSDGQRGSSSLQVSFESAESEGAEVEVISERIRPPPTFASDRHARYHSETSTSGRGEEPTHPSPRQGVTVVTPGNPRIPIGKPIRHLFGSLSSPKDGEVVFFTDVLKQGVRLPLQPAIQRILAHLGYAPGQYNPNFWVALMGVIIAFGLAGEGEPSYEQFSCLYSVTKSKSADHGGWVQANCLRAAERGHFVSRVPTSQKSWRNRRVLLSGDWESLSDRPVRFSVPTVFQITDRVKQPTPSREDIQKVERVRTKDPPTLQATAVGPSDTDLENQTLSHRLRQMETQVPHSGGHADPEELRRDITGKRLMFVDLEGPARTKRTRVPEQDRAIFVIEDDDEDEADPVNIACPPKAVQFANHMIVGSQM